MELFLEAVSVVGGIALVIVVTVVALTLFFHGIARFARGGRSRHDDIPVRKILKTDTLATVYAGGGRTFERVRVLGFTRSDPIKSPWPYELGGMVILEDEQQLRVFVRAKNIQMIVVAPEGRESPGATGQDGGAQEVEESGDGRSAENK